MDNEASFSQYSADTFINAALLHWACNMCKIPVFVVSNQQMFVTYLALSTPNSFREENK